LAAVCERNVEKTTVLVLHDAQFLMNKQSTDLGWRLYTLKFFEQYWYGSLSWCTISREICVQTIVNYLTWWRTWPFVPPL